VNHAAAVSTLNDLIETSKVGERGFALAARDNREPGIVEVLKDGEESCRAAAVELQDQVRLLGGVAQEGEGRPLQAARRASGARAVAAKPISGDGDSARHGCPGGSAQLRRATTFHRPER
jgi:hypothetical protein